MMENRDQSRSRIRTQRQIGWFFLLSGIVLILLAFVMAKGEMPDWMGRSTTGPVFVVIGSFFLIQAQRLTKITKSKEK